MKITNGTSQGLFIVVAIVIFGIFIGLSYTLFGSEGLSKDIKGIFTTATEQATEVIRGNENLITLADFQPLGAEAVNSIVKTKDSIIFSSKPNQTHVGIQIPATFFEKDSSYLFEYDITLLEGSLDRLGGHIRNDTNSKFYIDGKLMPDRYYKGTDFSPVLNKTYKVKVEFSKGSTPLESSDWLLIQPNRVNELLTAVGPVYNTTYKVKVENASLIKTK